MNIVSTVSTIYRKVADHIGKIIAAIGGTLLTLDIAGQGDALKQQAAQYLGEKGAQKIGLILFGMAFIRFLYAGYKANQHKQQIDDLQAQIDAMKKGQAPATVAQPQPAIDPSMVKSVALVLIGFGLVACRFL